MFGRAGAVLAPAENRSVAVSDELRRFVFLDELLARVEIGHQVDDRPEHGRDFVAGSPNVEPKMVADQFRLLKMALLGPFPRGLAPEDLEQPDAIDRLMVENSLETFFARDHSLLPMDSTAMRRRLSPFSYFL